MSNVRISDLPAAGALVGTELFEISNAAVSQSTTAAAIVTLGNTYTADHDAQGFDIRDISNVELRETTGAPAGTVRSLYADATGVNINAIATTIFSVLIAGTAELTVSATEINAQSNNIVGAADLTLTGNINFPDGVRQTFNPNATNSGLNVGSHTADPGSPSNGDLFYNSTSNALRARINGAWVTLGAGGLVSINGDTTAAQVIAAGTGLGIVDVGATHTLSIDATVATLTGSQVLTNKTIAAASNTLTIASTDLTNTADIVLETIANTYTAGQKQSVASNGTNAGLRVVPFAGNPSAQEDGDIWYNSGSNQLFGRINGADVDLGASGGGEVFTWTANHDANGFALEDPLFADPTDTTKRLDIDLAGNATTIVLTLDINQSTNQTLTVPNITAADTIATNNFAATLLSKTLGTGTVFSVSPTINDGITFTFNPNATNAGINVGAHTADPSSPNDGDIYYNSTANELRARINAAWVDIAGPDTPWTVLHDAARFNLDNMGALIFSLSGPSVAPAVTDPYIAYDTALAPDALVYNVPNAIEHRFHVNGTEEFTMTSSLFNGNGNIIQNFTSLQLEAVTPGAIIQLENSSSSPPNGTTIAEIRWVGDTVSGGNVDYAIDRTVVRDNTSASPDGERQLLCESAGTLVEYIALNHNAGQITFFNREVSFTNGQGIVDPSFGREILTFTSVGTSAVNEINIENALTGNRPIIEASGDDANMGLEIRQVGDAPIVFADDDGAEELLILQQIAGAATDYLEITNATAAANVILAVNGSTANQDLEIRSRGEGSIILTNESSEETLQLSQVSGAATNFVEITNAITTTGPIISAAGSDTNVDLNVRAQGTGSVIIDNSPFSFGDTTELTIATGAITVTKSFHRVDTEADAATDDLDTINSAASQEGDVLVIRAENSARTVSVTEAGNIRLSATPFAMDNVEDTLTLIFDGSNWLELSRSDNGA